MQAEISYDPVMNDGMAFAEGCYRLPGKPWEVFIFMKERNEEITKPSHRFSNWESGVTGIILRVPLVTRLNKAAVQGMLSLALGVSDWREVRGPDSLVIR
jgi:hypothetical protein